MVKMRIQSSHGFGTRGLDAYWTCPEAIESLLILEGDRIPRRIWEPACGVGNIVFALQQSGRFVVASDIYDYGVVAGAGVFDYLTTPLLHQVEGLITNPPFRKAQAFAEKALAEVGYVALLVRTNFLIEGIRRRRFRQLHPPTRVWHATRRLPMMHRDGWTGNRSTSNTPYSWAIWESGTARQFADEFDWEELLPHPKPQRPPRKAKAETGGGGQHDFRAVLTRCDSVGNGRAAPALECHSGGARAAAAH